LLAGFVIHYDVGVVSYLARALLKAIKPARRSSNKLKLSKSGFCHFFRLYIKNQQVK